MIIRFISPLAVITTCLLSSATVAEDFLIAREKVHEGIEMLESFKIFDAISNHILAEGGLPGAGWSSMDLHDSLADADAFGADAYVDRIEYNGAGVVMVYFQNVIPGVDANAISYSATFTGSRVTWRCSTVSVEFKYLPPACQK